MRRALCIAGALLCSGSVFAASQRSFVSGIGVDTNPCSRTEPCRSFATAMLATSPNGEIVVLDSAGFGTLMITQAVAVVSPLGVHAGISAFSGDAVTVTAAANDVVVLRNLYINSQGASTGITFTSGSGLHIENCVVSGFSAANIALTPSTDAHVEITDTIARLSPGAAVYANSAVSLSVLIDRSRFEASQYGVVADRATLSIVNSVAERNDLYGFFARGQGAPTKMTIEGSVASGGFAAIAVWNSSAATAHNVTASNATFVAFYAESGGHLAIENCIAALSARGIYAINGADVSVANSTIANNTYNGIEVGGATVRLTRNTITRNDTGIDVNYQGTLNSAGDNFVDGNTNPNFGTITVVPKT